MTQSALCPAVAQSVLDANDGTPGTIIEASDLLHFIAANII